MNLENDYYGVFFDISISELDLVIIIITVSCGSRQFGS